MILKKPKNAGHFTGAVGIYPRTNFPDKDCKECNSAFTPVASSHLYCSEVCAERGYSRNYLRKAYDITLEQYEEMFADPHCRICGSEGFVISRNGKAKLAVDHNHSTGEVRGLLCHNCNRALGLFKEDIVVLQKAIEYLEGATTSRKTYSQVAGSAKPE